MAFNFSPKIVTDGLVLCLDAANSKSIVSGSTTWTDLSRGGNNGTLVNGPTFDSGSGGSIVFDGQNDYCNTTYFGGINENYTFSIWGLNPTNASSTYLTRGRDARGNGWSLGISNAGGQFFAAVVTTIPSTVQYTVFGGSFTSNTWYNITGVWINGVGISLYINGIFIATTNTTSTSLRTSTDGWTLGSISSTIFSNNKVANALVYNRALSSQEILQNYNATKGRFGL